MPIPGHSIPGIISKPLSNRSDAMPRLRADNAVDVVYNPSVPPLLRSHEIALERFLALLADDVHRERLPVNRLKSEAQAPPKKIPARDLSVSG